MNLKLWLLACGVVLVLSGCGQKGALYMPEASEVSDQSLSSEGS